MSDEGADWYKRYHQRWLGGVRGLTVRQIAIYDVVVELIYQDGGQTPNNPKYIAGFFADLGIAGARKTISELIHLKKLYENDGKISNKFAKNVVKTKEKLRETRRKTGEKGNRIRWEKTKNTNRFNETSSQKGSTGGSQRRGDKIREEEDPPHTPPEGGAAPVGGNGVFEKGKQLLDVIGIDPNDPTWFGDFSIVATWEDRGLDFELDILPSIQQAVSKSKQKKKPRSLRYYDKPVMEWYSRRKPDDKLVDHYVASKDSAQWRAWRSYRQANGQGVRIMDTAESFTVPTEWPPDATSPTATTH